MPVVHMQVPLLHFCPVPHVTPAQGSDAPPATLLIAPPLDAPALLESAPPVPGAPADEPLAPPLTIGKPALPGEPALPGKPALPVGEPALPLPVPAWVGVPPAAPTVPPPAPAVLVTAPPAGPFEPSELQATNQSSAAAVKRPGPCFRKE